VIANWALVVVTIYGGNPLYETLGVFPTQRACFAELERDQLVTDRDLPQRAGAPSVGARFYRCNAPTGRSEP
jgi:hypothetical protein